jgi:predicted aspartyl protease
MPIILKTFLVFIIVLVLPSCTTLQAIKLVNSGEIAPSNKIKSVIPFTLEGHPIFIKVRINNSKKNYKFILDTGALTIVSKQVAQELELQNVVEVQAGGTGGKSKKINLVQLKSITIGNSGVQNIAAGVVDFSEQLGKDIAGLLGSNFFKFFQVTIDYKNKELTLVQDAKTLPTQEGTIQIAFETDIKNGFAPIIRCVINGNTKATGMIDTGYPKIAGLPLAIMQKLDSFMSGNVLTAKGSMDGGIYGMENESYLLRINTLEIGSSELENIPSESHQHKSGYILLGNKFLSKYLVTIDYPAKLLILRPHRNAVFETNIDSYGMSLVKKDKKFIVSGIWNKSPAYKSGIEPGDEIIKVNSKDTHLLSFFELATIFLDEKASVMDIVYIQKNIKHKARLHKGMLLPAL